MKSLFEVIVQEILPTARAMVAKKLVDDYKLSQKKAAERLGISQPAVSQYKRDLRGSRSYIFENNKEILEKIDQIAKSLATSEIDHNQASLEICGLYKLIKAGDVGDLEQYFTL